MDKVTANENGRGFVCSSRVRITRLRLTRAAGSRLRLDAGAGFYQFGTVLAAVASIRAVQFYRANPKG